MEIYAQDHSLFHCLLNNLQLIRILAEDFRTSTKDKSFNFIFPSTRVYIVG